MNLLGLLLNLYFFKNIMHAERKINDVYSKLQAGHHSTWNPDPMYFIRKATIYFQSTEPTKLQGQCQKKFDVQNISLLSLQSPGDPTAKS